MNTPQWKHRLRLALALCVVLGVWLLMQPSPAHAEEIVVTSTLDSGAGTLRQAIADAASGDTIVFSDSMSIYLDSELSIAKTLTVDGGVYTVTVSGDSGNDGSRNVRAFNIGVGSVVTLMHLTITDCYPYPGDRGSGIYNTGTLTVLGCNISDNAASYGGAAINNAQGVLTVRDSVFSNNEGAFGGAILLFHGTLVIENSTFAGNSAPNGGGAIYYYQHYYNTAGSVTVLTSTFSGNSSWYGGGIQVRNANLVVQHSVFATNTAQYTGGGIYFDPHEGGTSYPRQMTVDNSTFVGNTGGTVYDGSMSAVGGGGIHNFTGMLTVRNSTFSGNSSPEFNGGAIVTWGTLTLLNSTLIGNSTGDVNRAGGIANYGTFHIKNTLIAGSFPGPDCTSGPPTTNINNLIEDGSCSGNGVNFISGDPRVKPLADNGGLRVGAGQATTLQTHALLPASPAIDAADPATCLPTDGRGEARDDLRCDIGAFEVQYADSDTVSKTFSDTVTHSFGPTWVSVTLALTDTGALTVTKHLACPGGTCDPGELPATWHITSALSDGLPITVSFCYTPELSGVADAASLRAFRWHTGTTGVLTWTLPISTGLTVADGCVTLTGIEAFSAWTLKDVSTGAETPTAISLRSFAARGGIWLAGLLLVVGALYGLGREPRRAAPPAPDEAARATAATCSRYAAPRIVYAGDLEI